MIGHEKLTNDHELFGIWAPVSVVLQCECGYVGSGDDRRDAEMRKSFSTVTQLIASQSHFKSQYTSRITMNLVQVSDFVRTGAKKILLVR